MFNTKKLSLSHVLLNVDNRAIFYTEGTCMPLAHTPGFSHPGSEQRARHWQLQRDAGVERLPIGEAAWPQQVLAHCQAFGVATRALAADAPCPVPELSADQRFVLSWEPLFAEVDEALALGHCLKPVLLGPLSFLWLGQARDEGFDRLDLLDQLLPVYGEILQRLSRQGVEWVQIDEPILGLELPLAWRSAFERAYHILQYSPLQKLLACHPSGLEANLGLAAGLPVAGLHIDLLRAPAQLPAVLDRLPAYKVLSLGVLEADSQWCPGKQQVPAQLEHAQQRYGANLWLVQAQSHAQAQLAQGVMA